MNKFNAAMAALVFTAALAGCDAKYPDQAYAQPPMLDASGVPVQQYAQQRPQGGFLEEHGDAVGAGVLGYMLGRNNNNGGGYSRGYGGSHTTVIERNHYTTVAPAQRYYAPSVTRSVPTYRPSTTYGSRGISTTTRSSGFSSTTRVGRR